MWGVEVKTIAPLLITSVSVTNLIPTTIKQGTVYVHVALVIPEMSLCCS